MRRTLAVAAALAAGLAAGGVLGLVGHLDTLDPGTPRGALIPFAPSAAATPAPPAVRPIHADTLLAWTPGHLPDGFASNVARLPGVDQLVPVMSGVAWLSRSFDANGRPVDDPPRGLSIPLEVAAADPGHYSPFLPPADRSVLAAVRAGQGALGQRSAAFRHLGAGATLWFGRHRVNVAGVLPDTEIGGHELFVSAKTARALGLRTDRYLLIDPAQSTPRARLTSRIRALLPSGVQVRIRGPGETPYFREGDAVVPQIQMKETFGEFAGTPLANGFIRIDPSWERTHIVTARVPILGRVTCNRALLPMLRGALRDLDGQGLGHLLHPDEFGGCFAPRFISEDPQIGISHHAWGAAIDLNVAENPFGHTPHMDPRVVQTFERWGFTWGGRWLVPDGMHFEFLRFPPSG